MPQGHVGMWSYGLRSHRTAVIDSSPSGPHVLPTRSETSPYVGTCCFVQTLSVTATIRGVNGQAHFSTLNGISLGGPICSVKVVCMPIGVHANSWNCYSRPVNGLAKAMPSQHVVDCVLIARQLDRMH